MVLSKLFKTDISNGPVENLFETNLCIARQKTKKKKISDELYLMFGGMFGCSRRPERTEPPLKQTGLKHTQSNANGAKRQTL